MSSLNWTKQQLFRNLFNLKWCPLSLRVSWRTKLLHLIAPESYGLRHIPSLLSHSDLTLIVSIHKPTESQYWKTALWANFLHDLLFPVPPFLHLPWNPALDPRGLKNLEQRWEDQTLKHRWWLSLSGKIWTDFYFFPFSIPSNFSLTKNIYCFYIPKTKINKAIFKITLASA